MGELPDHIFPARKNTQARQLLDQTFGIIVEAQRRSQCREDDLVQPERTLQRVPL